MLLWPAVAAAAGCDLTTADRVVLVDAAGDHKLWVATTGGTDAVWFERTGPDGERFCDPWRVGATKFTVTARIVAAGPAVQHVTISGSDVPGTGVVVVRGPDGVPLAAGAFYVLEVDGAAPFDVGLPTAFVRVWGTRPDARAITGDVTWSDTSEHLLGARGGLVDSVLDSTAFSARRGDCSFLPSVAVTADPKDPEALWAAAQREVPSVVPPAFGPLRLPVPRYRWTWNPGLGLFTTDGTKDEQLQEVRPDCPVGGVPDGVSRP